MNNSTTILEKFSQPLFDMINLSFFYNKNYYIDGLIVKIIAENNLLFV